MRRYYPVFDSCKSKKLLLLTVLLCNFCWGCAFRWGSTERTLPGGYRSIAIPIFKNYSPEPGAETYFTDAIIKEFERSKTARVVDSSLAEVILEGEIVEVSTTRSNATTTDLPAGTLLATSYSVGIKTIIKLRRASDREVMWTGEFLTNRSYSAPVLGASVINTVNPQYNLSAKRQNINKIALQLMTEAYDRMTESF
jgi:hypothetical protein